MVTLFHVGGWLEKISILHVDDEESFLEISSRFLMKMGAFDISTARSVQEALALMSEKQYEVIVSDYQMPETDGIEFLKILNSQGSEIPFILFTGKGREDVAIEALNRGASSYLQKGGDIRSQFHELASMISKAAESRRASVNLLDSQSRFRRLADSMSDLMVGLDDDFRVTFWNKAAEDALGIKSADAIGVSAFDLIPLVDGTSFEDALRAAASSRDAKSAVADLSSADGVRTFEIRVHPGEEGLLVFARDVTATKATADQLVESEERYKALVESSPNAVVVYATDTIIYANPAAVRLYGGDDENDLLGKRVFDLMPPEFAAETAARTRKMYDEAVPAAPRPVKVYTKTGGTLDMVINSIPITFAGRKAVQTVLRDVTEEKRAEALLRANQEELRTIIDSVPAMIIYQDVEGKFLRVNKPFTDATGVDEEVLRGRMVEDVLPGCSEAFSLRDRNVIEARSPLMDATAPFLAKQGIRWVRMDKMPYMNDAGEVVGVITVAQDITELKMAEEGASRVREQLEYLLSESSAVTYSCNAEDPFDATYISPNVKRLYGYEPENFTKNSGFWASMIHPDDSERVLRELQEIFEKGYHVYDYRWKRKDGVYAWIHDEVRLTKNEEGAPEQMVGLWLDITDRKNAEAEREKKRRDFSLILDSAPIIIFYKDMEGRLLRVNKTFTESLKMHEDDLLGKTVFDIYSPDIAQSMTDDDLEVMSSGRPMHGIIERYESAEGVRWVQTEKVPIQDGTGNVVGLVGFAQDITERKRGEEALRMINKKLNLLSSITQHDSLNQLVVLRGWLDVAIENESDESVRALLLKADTAIDSLKMCVEFVSEYKALGVERPSWHSLEGAISKVVEDNRARGISFSVDVGDFEVFVDPMIDKVLRNLIDNSIEHGGHVDQISFSYRAGKEGLVIIYEDNGIGIPVDEKEKIFERRYGQARGYGLYLIREILSLTGITIKEAGTPAKGARFEMTVVPQNCRRSDGTSFIP
jgi:PAS domain S-box-containing protein